MTTVTRQGTIIIWPTKLPTEEWSEQSVVGDRPGSGELAKSAWVRIVPDMSLGAYRIYKAEGSLTDPIWPEQPFEELLEIAFRGRIIDREDHPVVRRLRGLT